MDRYDQITDEIARVMGAINVAHGRLVGLMATALAEGHAGGVGIHSPAHWLAWRAGLSPARARDVVKLAERASELPCATAALVEGELTLDQATEIARHVPASFDASVTRFAKVATVTQLRRALPDYGFEQPERTPSGAAAERREVSHGTDDTSWWINGRLPEDEGAVVARALQAAREDLYRQRRAELPADADPPEVTFADALVAMAEASLRAGQAAAPGSERYLVHAHLEAGPHGPQLKTHLGRVLPDHLRRRILCDATLRATLHRGSTPLSVGRTTRVISRRLRRLIEHRHDGCAVPGCGRTSGLEIHHIEHWEDGGTTDTHNLVCLCATHHRLHHRGVLAITGNPEIAAGQPGALTFRDVQGRVLDPSGTPIPYVPDTSDPPVRYRPPLGERLDRWGVHFNEAPPPDSVRPPGHDPPRAGPSAA